MDGVPVYVCVCARSLFCCVALNFYLIVWCLFIINIFWSLLSYQNRVIFKFSDIREALAFSVAPLTPLLFSLIYFFTALVQTAYTASIFIHRSCLDWLSLPRAEFIRLNSKSITQYCDDVLSIATNILDNIARVPVNTGLTQSLCWWYADEFNLSFFMSSSHWSLHCAHSQKWEYKKKYILVCIFMWMRWWERLVH